MIGIVLAFLAGLGIGIGVMLWANRRPVRWKVIRRERHEYVDPDVLRRASFTVSGLGEPWPRNFRGGLN